MRQMLYYAAAAAISPLRYCHISGSCAIGHRERTPGIRTSLHANAMKCRLEMTSKLFPNFMSGIFGLANYIYRQAQSRIKRQLVTPPPPGARCFIPLKRFIFL